MDYQTIRLSIADDIATLTLNRPDVMNALNTQMRAEILHAVKAAGQSARVRNRIFIAQAHIHQLMVHQAVFTTLGGRACAMQDQAPDLAVGGLVVTVGMPA